MVPDGSLHELPSAVGWSAGALIEPLANAVHAWELVGDPAASGVERAAVIGGGSIGLLCGLVGRERGIEIVVTEPSPHRRRVAQHLGLAVLDELDSEYDAVIDAVGLDVTRNLSLRHCRPAGVSVWLGLGADQTSVSGHDVVRSERRILGSFAYTPTDFAQAVDMAERLDLTWTTDVPLERSDAVFRSLADGATEIVKAVIVPGRG